MATVVIYPPEFMGGKIEEFLYTPKSTETLDILKEVRLAFEDITKQGLPARLKVRPMQIGDVINVEEKLFIVTASSFRSAQKASVDVWLKRTLIERMMGSGLHAKISGEHAGVTL